MPKGDREILKADPEDGTTPIANLLLEAIAVANLTGREKGILLYLCRKTYGWVKEGKRLKETTITLKDWTNLLQTDTSRASKLLSGLTEKGIIKRQFLGPGKGYVYALNTRVGEWDKSCINEQLLSSITRQGLSQTTRLVLSKTTTPLATNLASPKERLNKVLNKDDDNNIFSLYETEIGQITPHIATELNDAIEEYGEDAIKEAIKIAVKQNVRKWAYVERILVNNQTGKSDDLISGQSIDKAIRIARGELEVNARNKKVCQEELDRRGVLWRDK